jgi:hypothetical protein
VQEYAIDKQQEIEAGLQMREGEIIGQQESPGS